MRKWLLKSILYVFSVNALATVIMLLDADDVINDVTSLIVSLVIFVVSAPLYFFIKGNTSRPWLYTVASAVSYIAFAVARILVLNAVYNGWERVVFFFGEIFTLVFFVAVLLLDVAVNIFSKISNRGNEV
jgi:hypothetical protein